MDLRDCHILYFAVFWTCAIDGFAHCSFFRLHFWTPVMSPPAAIYFYDSIFGPQLWTPILYFLLTNFETCTCSTCLGPLSAFRAPSPSPAPVQFLLEVELPAARAAAAAATGQQSYVHISYCPGRVLLPLLPLSPTLPYPHVPSLAPMPMCMPHSFSDVSSTSNRHPRSRGRRSSTPGCKDSPPQAPGPPRVLKEFS